MEIRTEQPGDAAGVRRVLVEAFPTDAEARLVDLLREDGSLVVALVVIEGGEVVGHIAFSPVASEGSARGVGLAPVAVDPAMQSRGVGAALVRAGLAACAAAGFDFCVVLGEPGYYKRFGFAPACEAGLSSEYDAGEAFMAMALRTGGLDGARGLVRYAPAFAAVE